GSCVLMPPPPCPALFAYTTLFRSLVIASLGNRDVRRPVVQPVHDRRFRGARVIAQQDAPLEGGHLLVRQRMLHSVPVHLGLLARSEEHTSELQSREKLVCRLLLEK